MSFSPEFGDEIEACRDQLLSHARRMTGDPDLAEDLVQDTYVKALRKAETYTPGNLSSWLLTLQRNVHLDNLRQKQRRPAEVQAEGDPRTSGISEFDRKPHPSAEEVAAEREQGKRIMDLLSRLPRQQKLAVYLVDVVGFDYKETAKRIGVPRGSLASSLSRGRAQLRQRLI